MGPGAYREHRVKPLHICLIVVLLAAALSAVGVGLFSREHHMLFSYAVIVCLSCMGIG